MTEEVVWLEQMRDRECWWIENSVTDDLWFYYFAKVENRLVEFGPIQNRYSTSDIYEYLEELDRTGQGTAFDLSLRDLSEFLNLHARPMTVNEHKEILLRCVR